MKDLSDKTDDHHSKLYVRTVFISDVHLGTRAKLKGCWNS